MWKYASRRCRDTFERGVSYFDKRSATGLTNSQNCVNDNKENGQSSPCCWFKSRKCWGSSSGSSNTNNKRWNFDHLNGSWLGAITWSSALVLGWYAGQVIHFKYKYQRKRNDKTCVLPSISQALKPYVSYVGFGRSGPLLQTPRVEKPVSNYVPTVYLISNDQGKDKSANQRTASTSGSSAKTESSDGDLGEVLNSIENKLGLAAIENGQHKEGLNLLRSAANRSHAPALYNLGLCYEMGLGVKVDEKVAMELYRSAASLEHASALYNLGIYYGQGRGGLARDTATATRLLRLAAVKGNQEAITALKSLEVEAEPITPVPSTSCQEDMAPMHSALFIGHVNTLMAQM